MSFLSAIDGMLPAAITGAAGLIVWYLKELSKTVGELNLKMALFVEKITTVAEHLEDHESRIRDLEANRYS